MSRRDTQIEVMRSVLMFLIVFWHCSMCCPQGDARVSKFLACMPVFSVDAFILISGWYGVSFSFKKIVKLLWMGLYASLLVLVLTAFNGQICFRYSLGWYGLAYLALLVLAPLINAGVEYVCERGIAFQFWLAYSTLIILSWVPIASLSFDFCIPGFGGISVNTMVYVYVTGRLLRYWNWADAIKQHTVVLLFLLLFVVNLIFAYMSWKTADMGSLNLLFSCWRVNDSPLVLGMATCFFLMMYKLVPPNWLGRMAVILAPSMFSVYLIHCGVNFQVTRRMIGRFLFHNVTGPTEQICLTVLASFIVFVFCIVCDLIRRAGELFCKRIWGWAGNNKRGRQWYQC